MGYMVGKWSGLFWACPWPPLGKSGAWDSVGEHGFFAGEEDEIARFLEW
jgi:hypothetical protein